MLVLKQVLEQHRLKQVELAKALSLSPAAIAQLLNHGIFPKSIGKEELTRNVYQWAKTQGIDTNIALFNEVVIESGNSQSQGTTSTNEDETMVLRKQVLTQAAKKTFKLLRNPFDEPNCSDDLYFNHEARLIREELYLGIQQPRYTMLIGESGSGKSTLIQDLKSRVFKNDQNKVIFIEPYVLGMEDNDLKGKTLKVAQIVEAVMRAIAPTEHTPRSLEKRYDLIHRRAKDLAADGKKLVILIEEAHSTPKPTLKHLRRFFELRNDDGFTRLFSVLLVGQTELANILSVNDPDVREVVARCTNLELLPLADDLGDYLSHLLSRVNKKLDEVITPEAIATLKQKLFKRGHSRLYPLLINNIMTAALNEAAYTEQDLIYPDIIEAVAI